jgi:hypothetical protein
MSRYLLVYFSIYLFKTMAISRYAKDAQPGKDVAKSAWWVAVGCREYFAQTLHADVGSSLHTRACGAASVILRIWRWSSMWEVKKILVLMSQKKLRGKGWWEPGVHDTAHQMSIVLVEMETIY